MDLRHPEVEQLFCKHEFKPQSHGGVGGRLYSAAKLSPTTIYQGRAVPLMGCNSDVLPDLKGECILTSGNTQVAPAKGTLGITGPVLTAGSGRNSPRHSLEFPVRRSVYVAVGSL
jgi:hypothetical protein